MWGGASSVQLAPDATDPQVKQKVKQPGVADDSQTVTGVVLTTTPTLPAGSLTLAGVITFIGSSSDAAGNGGTCQIDLATNIPGLAEDDLLIVALVFPDAGDIAVANAMRTQGYTPIADLFADDTNDTNLGVFMKFMNETVDTFVLASGTASATSGNIMGAMAFRGVDRTRPLDVVSTTATGTGSVLANPPEITPSGASGVWTVAIGAGGHNEFNGTFTGPTNYTTDFLTGAGTDTLDSSVGIGYNSSPSNPENPGAFGFSGADDATYSWAAVTLALRPIEVPTDIWLVGSTSGTAVNGGDVTLTLPTCLENDIVIVAAMIPTLGDIDVAMNTAGYTEVADLFADDTNDTNLGVFYKVMGVTPDTTAVVTGGGNASDGNSAVALVFRNVDPTTPMDVAATTATGVNSGNANPASINYDDTNAVIVVALANGHAVGASGGFIFPTGYLGIGASGDDSRDSAVALAFGTSDYTSDPEDPTAVEVSYGDGLSGANNLTNSWAAVTMALAKVVSEQTVDGVVLTTTPTLPAGKLNTNVTGVVLTTTPSLPAGKLNTNVTGVVLTTTPTLPQALLNTGVTGVVLTTTPTLPAGALTRTVAGVVLTTTPTLPAGSLNTSLTGVVLTTTPTLPAGGVQLNQVGGVVLTTTPSLPAGALRTSLTGIVLTTTPTLPVGSCGRA